MRLPYAKRNILSVRGPQTWPRAALCLGMVLACGCAPLAALDSNRAITQLAHRSWGAKEGAPALPRALVQSTDGFLWIGSYQGLYRFDGIRFEPYEAVSGDALPSKKVRSLLALPNGELWIGSGESSISVLKNGRIKTYRQADGVPNGLINAIAQDHQGRIWAATDHGLILFDGRRWKLAGKDWNCPEDPEDDAETVFVDRHGTVWVGIGTTVLYLPEGSKRFVETGEFAVQVNKIAEAPDGTLWMADTGLAVRPIGMPGSARLAIAHCEAALARKGILTDRPSCNSSGIVEIQVGSAGFLFDKQGSLWIGTAGDGLRRVRHPEQLQNHRIKEFDKSVEIYTSQDGLSADYDLPIIEDKEGNIWVGTKEGLDQFRDTKLVPVVAPSRINDISIAPDTGGDIWVSGNGRNVARTHGESMKIPLVLVDAYQLYRDDEGGVWAQGVKKLLKLRDGKFREVANIPGSVQGIVVPRGRTQIAGDHSGTLWAFVERNGFLSLNKNKWEPFRTSPDVSRLVPNTAYTDSTGRIWVGTRDGVLVTMEKGAIETYRAADVGVGVICVVYEYAGRIWVGGSLGFAMLDGRRFRPVPQVDMSTFTDVSGIIGTDNSGLWLSENRGILHISRDQIEQCVHSASCRISGEVFDSLDGVPGVVSQSRINPTSIKGTDGRLWFVTTKGVAWVDPTRIERNEIPPPVAIMSVIADGSTYARPADLPLPAHTENIQINYTALSFAVPERVRFRYMLNRIDKQWQESGTRREAYYSRLPPGRYHFRVVACNNDGLWNEVGASVEFTVAPAFYQTVWFQVLCALLAGVLIWLAYTFRVKQVTAQIQEHLGARLEERERIARELHDTLLQGFQGLMLRFQAVMKTLPADQPAHRMMEQVLDRADEVLLEGRQSVRDLREKGSSGSELTDSLSNCGKELALGHSALFILKVVGVPRPIEPVVFDESYRIAREALINAFQHSKATEIETEVTYSDSGIVLRIRDDGTGIAADIVTRGRKGHWGFSGMRERAYKIGAKMAIWSSPGVGTEIELTIPAKVAYVGAKSQTLWQSIKR